MHTHAPDPVLFSKHTPTNVKLASANVCASFFSDLWPLLTHTLLIPMCSTEGRKISTGNTHSIVITSGETRAMNVLKEQEF